MDSLNETQIRKFHRVRYSEGRILIPNLFEMIAFISLEERCTTGAIRNPKAEVVINNADGREVFSVFYNFSKTRERVSVVMYGEENHEILQLEKSTNEEGQTRIATDLTSTNNEGLKNFSMSEELIPIVLLAPQVRNWYQLIWDSYWIAKYC